MRNIDIAKSVLEEESMSVVMVKNQEIIYKSKDSGIKPLLFAYRNNLDELEGVSVADKVIGKAAALLLIDEKIHDLYAELISDAALEVFRDTDIKVIYGQRVERILNRDQTDLCPMEKLAQDETEGKVVAEKIEDFFGGKNWKLEI